MEAFLCHTALKNSKNPVVNKINIGDVVFFGTFLILKPRSLEKKSQFEEHFFSNGWSTTTKSPVISRTPYKSIYKGEQLPIYFAPISPHLQRYRYVEAADGAPIFWWITAVVLLLTVSLGLLSTTTMGIPKGCHGSSKQPAPQKSRPKGQAGGSHNPLVRPAICWGGWHWGTPLDSVGVVL